MSAHGLSQKLYVMFDGGFVYAMDRVEQMGTVSNPTGNYGKKFAEASAKAKTASAKKAGPTKSAGVATNTAHKANMLPLTSTTTISAQAGGQTTASEQDKQERGHDEKLKFWRSF